MMSRLCRLLLLAALSACSSESGSAWPPSSENSPYPEAAAAHLQRTLNEVVRTGVAPGVSVVVDESGYAPWAGSAGVRDLETGQALAPKHRFRAGSMLKVAIATAVLQQVESGVLSLEQRLPGLLPEEIVARIPHAAEITLRMLLNHTSGIAELTDEEFDRRVAADPTHVWTLEELLDRAFKHAPSFEPGAGWSYSNTNYVLLGEILSRATGKPWRWLLRENVFARAEMFDTQLPEEGNTLCDGCSRGYEFVEGTLIDLTEVDPSMCGAAGGDALVTTPADLAKLLVALIRGALFESPATLERMREFTVAPDPEQAQTGYGLGLARLQVGSTELIGHIGGTAGFQGFMLYRPSTGMTVSGFMNRRGDLAAFVLPGLEAIERGGTTE
ncbi:MAG TPA: serine hydrolase domain-containing protein [Polyangiaceae bacterium]|nr:serine hydrolase domain-containing protein [Polyangiaceae bacterium]